MNSRPDVDPVGSDAVQIPPDVSSAVLDEGRRAAPEEACGLLVGHRKARIVCITKAVPCANTAPESLREERFSIDPLRVIDTERSLRGSGEGVMGFYHSHPASEARPSKVDVPFMELWPEMVWLIVGQAHDPCRASLRLWASPLDHGRPPGEIPIEIPG